MEDDVEDVDEPQVDDHEESEHEESEETLKCHDCGNACKDSEEHSYRSNHYCESCYRKHVPKCDDCNEECENDQWWVGGVSKHVYCDECWDYYEHKQCLPYLRDRHDHCDICEAHDHAKFYIRYTNDDGTPHCKICSSPLMIRHHRWR
jgi:hypothetical protein